MAGSFAETTRWKLRRLLGASKVSDVDEGFQRLAEDCDNTFIGMLVDTLAKRPGASMPNRIFRASDTGNYYLDTGTEWIFLPHGELASAAQGISPHANFGNQAEPFSVRSEANGQVKRLAGRGENTPTTITAGTRLATLPVGYRPSGDRQIVAGVTTSAGASASSIVLTISASTGEVKALSAIGNGATLNLNGITFEL